MIDYIIIGAPYIEPCDVDDDYETRRASEDDEEPEGADG